MKARVAHVRSWVAAALVAAVASTPGRAAADPPVERRTVAIVAAGVAVVGAGVATTFGVLALQNKHDYDRGPTFSNVDLGTNDAAYADGGLALAVVAGVTSLILFLTSDAAATDPGPRHSTSPGAVFRF